MFVDDDGNDEDEDVGDELFLVLVVRVRKSRCKEVLVKLSEIEQMSLIMGRNEKELYTNRICIQKATIISFRMGRA